MNSNAWQSTQGRPGRQQKKTSLSQQRIWSSALLRNTQRPCQEKLHLTRHPYLHVCKIRAAVSVCVQMWHDQQKIQRVLCCVCSSEHDPDLTLPAASAPSLSPQKSLPLLRRGLILNRYTGNSSLEWLRKQTGRSVFTAALTEQLGKGTVPDLSLLPFTCCWIFSLPGMQRIPLVLQLLPVCVHRGAGQGKGTQWRARGHDNN